MKNRFKKLCNVLGYNQQTFAEKLSIDVRKFRSYIYETKNFPVEFLISLSEVLNVNVNWLLTGNGDMFISSGENTLDKTQNLFITKNIESFHKRFNQLQKKNDLNDFEFSKLTGISESKIEKLGIGKVLPTVDELISLKSNFDVSIDWLLFGANSNNAQNLETTLSTDEINILKKIAKNFND